MLTYSPFETAIQSVRNTIWFSACHLSDILPATGVTVLIDSVQIAIFRVESVALTECFAISNFDPFSKAYVLSRGLIGDKSGILKVASPIYKNTFNLRSGQCLEDESVVLATWPTQIVDGIVQIAF